jgi:hypothetical protein
MNTDTYELENAERITTAEPVIKTRRVLPAAKRGLYPLSLMGIVRKIAKKLGKSGTHSPGDVESSTTYLPTNVIIFLILTPQQLLYRLLTTTLKLSRKGSL